MGFTRQFYGGLLTGLGLGLLLGAAFVELEWLTPYRKAWVSVLGVLFFPIGTIVAKKGQTG